MREILDHLMDAGYDPAEDGDWADLVASGVGSIRVDWSEDGEIRVHRFDRYLATLWSSRFDRAMPAEIILAAIEAAEAELARDAGRPVTPAQVQADTEPCRLGPIGFASDWYGR